MADLKSIKSWAEEDRPREKLALKGKESLSNAELLAIIMGSGSTEESAVGLSKKVLSEAGSLNNLGRKSLDFFTAFKGIGPAKAISIAAALELGRRRQAEPREQKQQILSSQDAYDVLAAQLSDLNHEEFWIVLLNNQARVKATERISSGGVSQVLIDAKMVFRAPVSQLATRIILYHNHPSGNSQPSQHDIQLTKKLVEAGKHLDIAVEDHIIISQDGYYSFRDEGMI